MKEKTLDSVKCVSNALTPELYTYFHELAGFRKYSLADIALALQGTLYSIVAYQDGKPIGIARVVGDGRIVFLIKDVIVHPEYQGCQYGRLLMEKLLEYIRYAGCPGAYIGLMSTCGKEPFYEKFGFLRRPNESHGAGMILHLGEEAN